MSGEHPYCVLCGWGAARCACHEPTLEEFREQNADWHHDHTDGSSD